MIAPRTQAGKKPVVQYQTGVHFVNTVTGARRQERCQHNPSNTLKVGLGW